jgi:hypothetical protein
MPTARSSIVQHVIPQNWQGQALARVAAGAGELLENIGQGGLPHAQVGGNAG